MKKNFYNKSFKKLIIAISVALIIVLMSVICIINISAAPVTSGNFTVDYSVQSDWGNGASINVTLKNNGPAVNGWNVSWSFSGNQKITDLWNATYTQSGSSVTVNSLNRNESIPSNGSVSFGMNISYSGTNASPSNFSVNSSSSTQITTTAASSTPVVTPTKVPTSSSTPVPSPTTSSKGKFHCFLLLGQSNMAGYPKAQDSDKVQNERIRVLDYNSNQWRVAVPPLHETWQGAIGPGDWFSKTIINNIPAGDTIGLIPCAISGEKIETFMKSGGSKYSWIISRSQLAQQAGGVIDGIIFHQGESNNGDSSWPGKVNTLVTDLRTDLKLGNVPFIAGELLYSGSCAGHNKLVNQLPSVVKNCYVVSASGLVVDPADTQYKLHFGHDSQVTLGKRYAEKMIGALGW